MNDWLHDHCLMLPVSIPIISRSRETGKSSSERVATSLRQKGMMAVTRGVFFLAALLFAFNAAAATAVTLEELLQQLQEYDGKTVIYKGEVIGDIMVRQSGAWVNVHDGTGAIGVFCPKEQAEKIEYQGGYKFSGDIISVRGTFQSACPEHGGDTDIHAEKITVIERGEALEHPIEPQKVKASIYLSIIVFALAIIHLIIRRFR